MLGKNFRKPIALGLIFMLLLTAFVAFSHSNDVLAASIKAPKFSLKSVNEGTGVKITISKTKGATGYYIIITNRVNEYSSYQYNNGKHDFWIKEIKKNGKKKREFTIKGLPAGTYTFKVVAYDKDDNEVYSKEKSIEIKAVADKKAEEKTYDFSNAKVGDIIRFGSYEQDANMLNGKEEIEWIVLEKTKKQMLVVSRYALDCLPYNTEWKDVTWENCTLRKWLNSVFYNKAFSNSEKSLIKTVKLANPDNSDYGTNGGNDTKDNVFLLSLEDINKAEYGFSSEYLEYDYARRCAPTEYAFVQGAKRDAFTETDEGEKACRYWLRSPGELNNYAANVYVNGCVRLMGDNVHLNTDYAIRPAIYISLSSD